MTLTLRTARRVAALVTIAAIAAFNAARANHYILPCPDKCIGPGWVLTGSLNTARQNHTATLLGNGKVLVAGGSNDSGAVLASAELYDPATGTWSLTDSMTKPRAGHFAFMLPTGAVLIVGGDQPCCNSSITVELYDPDTGRWSSADSRGPTVGIYAATMLQSNDVFVTGGFGWLYDPIRRTWNQTNWGPVFRQAPDATLLPNGDVLIVGGTNDADEVVIVPGAELYDPVTGAWRLTTSPNLLRVAGTNTRFADGSVLAAGGFSWATQGDKYSWTTYPVPTRSSVSYGQDGIWQPVGDLNEARYSHTATLMPDGRVLVSGGEALQSQENAPQTYPTLRSAELYESRNAAWTYTDGLNIARARHTATLLDDGSVLVVGGIGVWAAGSAVLGSAERYLPDFNASQ